MAQVRSKVPVTPRSRLVILPVTARPRPGAPSSLTAPAAPGVPGVPLSGAGGVAPKAELVAGGSGLSLAEARAALRTRTPAIVRIAALRESVRSLLEANRRLRRLLAASEARMRELAQDRAELLAELTEARIDPVSGLVGRRAFTRHAAELLYTTQRSYSVVLLDLDDFKPVNDRFGHQAGDAVLAAVGHRITGWLGPGESAGRLGGDEFVILAVHDTRLPGRLDALREAISAPVWHDGLTMGVGVSAGSAQVTGGLSQALGEADSAMYEAKGSGRRGRTTASPGDV